MSKSQIYKEKISKLANNLVAIKDAMQLEPIIYLRK